MLSFIEFLSEAVSSNDKGVLHELLVGKHMNHGIHMSPEAEKTHNEIKSRITPEEYTNHEKMAKATADELHKKFGEIHSAHWSSKPGDIKRITGHDESQQENSADIILRHKDGTHNGISLKITQKKGGKVGMGNPGAAQTDKQLGTDAVKHYAAAHKELEEKHPELKGKPKSEQKKIIKENPKMKASAVELSNKALGKIRDEWHGALSKMDTGDLSNHIRNNLMHANKTKVPLYKATTGGHGDDNSTHIEHSETSHDHILGDHKNITVKKSGNNSVEFQHKGKTFLRHRLKPESTPLVSGLKGSVE